jgi:UDP-glucose 4-epimerase
MRVVMTGGGGFIGSHLLARMVGVGMDVTLVGSNTGKSRYTAALVAAGKVRFLRCDDGFTEEAVVRPALAEADALVLLGYTMPSAIAPADRLAEEFARNVEPVVRLLRAAARGWQRQVLFASSVSVYGRPAGAPVRETDAPQPLTPYAVAKVASEKAIQEVCAASGWSACALRYSTVYGPGETVPRAIPNFIRAALDRQPPVINGDGLDEHDYVHVGDIVDATVSALRSRASGVYNIGTGIGTSTSDLAHLVAKLVGANVKPVFRVPERLPERVRMICATDLATAELGFTAGRSLPDGIAEEIGWFRSERNLSATPVLAATA